MKYGKLSRKNIETLERLAETPEGKVALAEFVGKQKEARSAYKRYVKIINKKEKTPNEIRAAFIERCKRYIKKYGEGVEFFKQMGHWIAHRPPSYCVSNINGVYNEYIGKANALAWLRADYDFVDETENAPQPRKVVRGSKVYWNNVEYKVIKDGDNPLLGVECQGGSLAAEKGVITDDTHAIYEEGAK